ncbi:hypothetical protein RB595_003979 [Gaeumannomyces hyphopodioides]
MVKRKVEKEHRGRKRRKLAEQQQREETKKQERQEQAELDIPHGDIPLDGEDAGQATQQDTREFFGMLSDEEQEYFRRADEMLELNDFPSPDERAVFISNVFKEAAGKELKLASSQSCSRLMERLILLSTTRQKKRLFDAFADHFPTLVTHRFGSHCCEQLFAQSAPIVSRELAGEAEEEEPEEEPEQADGEPKKALLPMEEIFLLVLDELEEHLTYLMTDTFGSHSLRVLLTVLAGRSLDQVSIKSLLQSKNKERISVPGAQFTVQAEGAPEKRPVPSSFGLAVQKIINDTLSSLDSTVLAVMVKHPTGNPIMQLLLELDIALNTKTKSRKKASEEVDEVQGGEGGSPKTLLERLLPGAPASLSDEKSEASRFVSGTIYDPIGSRLLETLVTHCPGKIFKGLYTHVFGPRVETLLRNETATYCLMRALNRLSKEDLAETVQKSLSKVELLLSRGRFSILATLFERCDARGLGDSTNALLKAVADACNAAGMSLVRKLCYLEGEGDEDKKDSKRKDKKDKKNKKGGDIDATQLVEPEEKMTPKRKDDLVRNGCKLATTLVSVGGAPAQAIQGSLLFLSPEELHQLATSTAGGGAGSKFLAAAIAKPSSNPVFHKVLASSLTSPPQQRVLELALSEQGHRVLNALALVPSKAPGFALPFFVRQSLVVQLASHENELRESWTGRKVWHAWKGDLWAHRPADWIQWAKEVEPEGERRARAPEVRVKKRLWAPREEDGAKEDKEPDDQDTAAPSDEVKEKKGKEEKSGKEKKERKEKKDKKEKKEKKKSEKKEKKRKEKSTGEDVDLEL